MKLEELSLEMLMPSGALLKSVASVVIVVLLNVLVPTMAYSGEGVDTVPFGEWLQVVGERCDCYFTLEIGQESRIRTLRLEIPKSVQSLDEAVALLQSKLTDASVERDKGNSVVIRICDFRKKGGNPALDEKIDFKYSGRVSGIGAALAKTAAGIRVSSMGPIESGGTVYDLRSVVIAAHDQTIRAILTNSLPLASNRRILWTAEETADASGNKVITVVFGGPVQKRLPPSSGGSGTEQIIGFERGELAYYANAFSPTSENNALEFIRNRFANGDKSQVRWAMLFLGHYRSEKAIPELIKDIDYQYANCTIVQESFPAVAALISESELADVALVDALKIEKEPKRASLLAFSIREIEGEAKSLVTMKPLRESMSPSLIYAIDHGPFDDAK